MAGGPGAVLGGWRRRCRARCRAHRALGFALALSAGRIPARGYVLTGFPWALIGHVWIGTPLAQVAALRRADGLTLLTLLAAALPVALRLAGPGGCRRRCWRRWRASALWRLAQPDPADSAGHPAAGAAQCRADAEMGPRAWRGSISTACWPSPPTDAPAPRSGDLARNRGALSAGTRTPNWPTSSPRPRRARRRSSASSARKGCATTTAWPCWTPTDGSTARYDKHHLVPFGEYIPLGDLAYRPVRPDGLCGAGRATAIPPGRGPRCSILGRVGPGAAADLLRGGLSAGSARTRRAAPTGSCRSPTTPGSAR